MNFIFIFISSSDTNLLRKKSVKQKIKKRWPNILLIKFLFGAPRQRHFLQAVIKNMAYHRNNTIFSSKNVIVTQLIYFKELLDFDVEFS